MGIRKTNIASSATLSIPLKDPKEKFGDVFKVNKVFVENNQNQATLSIDSPEEGRQLYSQEVHGKQLNIKWNIREPKNGSIITDNSMVRKNQYISHFDVFVYRRTEAEVDSPSFDGGTLIDSRLNLTSNNVTINVSGENDRYLNFAVAVNDVFGNRETGNLFVYNQPPTGEISSIRKVGGNMEIEYTGSRDLEGVNMYLFTGSNSYGKLEDTSEFKSGYKIKTINSNGIGVAPLIPGKNNYLMVTPFDDLGEGGLLPFSSSHDPYEPSGANFYPSINDLKVTKVEGGNSSLVTLEYDWQDHEIVDLIYKVNNTGSLSTATSGYNNNILLDHASITDQVATQTSDSYSFYFDHTYDFINGTHSGELTHDAGMMKLYGSGAGAYLEDGELPYSGQSGQYDYAYYDVDQKKICFSTLNEIKSGELDVNGSFSMEANNPNDYNINFREGVKFRKTYEMSSSYLNKISEMPAVILNKSQLNKMNSYSGAKGWIGLRRRNVGLLDNIFKSNVQNESVFNLLDPQETVSGFKIIGDGETSEFIGNNVGNNWSWVNSSGSHIYRELGVDFNPDQNIIITCDFVKKENKQNVGSYTRNHIFQRPKLINLGYNINEDGINFDYEIEDSFYKENPENIDINSIQVHSGEYLNFDITDDSLIGVVELDINSESSLQSMHVGTIFIGLGDNRPEFVSLIPYDEFGRGLRGDINETLQYRANTQYTQHSLDSQFANNETEVNVDFDLTHTSEPSVNFNINYKGSSSPSFINAMLIGEPTTSGAVFLLSQPPTSEGYFLSINSSSS